MDISQAASLMARSKKGRVKETKSDRKAQACRANALKAREAWAKMPPELRKHSAFDARKEWSRKIRNSTD